MRRLAVLFGLLAMTLTPSGPAWADSSSNGSCDITDFGAAVLCGGGYVTPAPAAATPSSSHNESPPTTRPVLVEYVANGPNGACLAFGPPSQSNSAVSDWLSTLQLPPCPATPQRLAPINPAALAVNFWRTIPLPVPQPSIPPGYAITGKPAYLVTNGQTSPAPYVESTPLGQLTVTAHGSYSVDWGDGSSPTWTGPYSAEGEAWPNGSISHTYDQVGTVTIVVREAWTATWSLAGASGVLGGLQTTATISDYPVQQEQAVITN